MDDEFDNYNIDMDIGGEDEYGIEAKAFERASLGGKLAELMTSTLTDKKKGERNKLTPEDRFLIGVDAECRRLTEEGEVLTQDDIDNMLEKSQSLKGLKYKNVSAYILGYIASNGGKSLEKKKVMRVLNDVLPMLKKTSGVEKPDVIRYARLWTNLT